MGHEVKDPCGIRSHTHGNKHVSQLADCRISQDLLDVILAETDGGGKDGCGHAHDRHNGHGNGCHVVEDIAPGDHIDACSHHGGRMDQRANWRGTFHRIRKPDIEGNLCRLPAGAHKEQEGDGRDGRCVELVGIGEDLGEIERPDPVLAQAGEEEEHPQEKTEVTHAVDDKGLLSRIGRRILLIPEADQKIGAEAHAFPTYKHQ